MKKVYLDDLAVGQVYTSDASIAVDATAIKQFAGSFDPQPFHLDESAARTSFFKELVASGWHTTAMTMSLIVQTLPLSHGVIGSGVDELRWHRPIRPGDVLRVRCEIEEVRRSESQPSRGAARVRFTTLDQNDMPVQSMVGNLLAFARPPDGERS
jgi:acyl dehydratase